MSISTKQYAEALSLSLKGKKEGERKEILSRFLEILKRNKDERKIDLILKEVERVEIESSGNVRVHLEAPRAVSSEVKEKIVKILGKPAIFSEKTDPSLLAGIRILVNDTTLIDATAHKRLQRLQGLSKLNTS